MLLKEIKENDYEKIGRLFKSGQGAEVLGILTRVFYNTISFDPDNTHTTAYREGHRDIVQVLRQAVEFIENKEKNDERQ